MRNLPFLVCTHHLRPPIPDRNNDWVAYYDGFEEQGPAGFGSTEQAAIQDLIDNYDAPEEQNNAPR